MLKDNNIPFTAMTVSQTLGTDPILSMLINGGADVDITMCNPPFFGSADEMREGRELKMNEAHAVSIPLRELRAI